MIKDFLRKKIRSFLQLDSIVKNISIQNRIDMLNYLALNCKEYGTTNEKYSDQQIIVSLTTYGKRLNQVYLTIESLMQQSLKPNKIILWLDYGFQDKQLPQLLKKQIDRGLQIKFCNDIRSYTKLIPSLKLYPNDVIITADDDLFYNLNMIENLVLPYLQNPNYIYFNRGHRIKFLKDEIVPYTKWEWNINSTEESPLNFPTGVGGVLYPPNSFNQEVFNESVFMDICPLADDIWFKAMSLYNGMPSKKVITFSENGDEYLMNKSVQDIGLHLQNVEQEKNDVQFKAVFDKYNLISKIR